MDAAFEITKETVGDLIYQNGGLKTDSGLKTAILISLFSDARERNQRGWWGGEIGSKLWTLQNVKRSAETLKKAQDFAQEALSWLIEEKICKKVSVSAAYDNYGRLILSVDLQKYDGNARFDFYGETTMAFNTPSYEDLLEQNKANIRSKFPDASLLSRSFLTVYAKIIAMATYGLYKFGEWIFRQIFIDTADAENLERHAKNRGKPRKEASFAQGNVIFKGTDGISIPADTELKRADGVFYKTISSAGIADGQAVVPVKAVNAGQSGNLEADSILSMTSAIVGVETTVTVSEKGISGGYDVEDIEDLRARLKSFIQNPPLGGADSDYIAWAKEVPGVTRAWCYPNAMGLGTVTVRFVMDNKTDTILPGENEINAVRDYIMSKVPATVEEVYVMAPTAKVIDFVINDLNPADDDTKAGIRSNLEDLFLSAEPGKVLKLNAIRNAVITVTEDHVLAAPTADIHTQAHELAILGTISYGTSEGA